VCGSLSARNTSVSSTRTPPTSAPHNFFNSSWKFCDSWFAGIARVSPISLCDVESVRPRLIMRKGDCADWSGCADCWSGCVDPTLKKKEKKKREDYTCIPLAPPVRISGRALTAVRRT
jgi:hypothetical protein